MDFAPHLLLTLAARRQGSVEVIYHPPVPVDTFSGRKELAAHCERVSRGAHGVGGRPMAAGRPPAKRKARLPGRRPPQTLL
jgi:hypothetical protein